ncbi:MAG: tetratricopeptide repeat protein, partial [Candidatus Binatia bacterium]
KGEKQPQVIREEFGLTFAEFDQAFHTWAKDQINTWGFGLTPPEEVATVRAELEKDDNNPAILGRLAQALFDAEDFQKAFDVSRQTLELDPNQPLALEVLVRVTASLARQESDPEIRRAYEAEATPALDRLLQIDPDNEYALRYGAHIALRHEDQKRAETLLIRLQAVCPMDPTSWNGLAGIYLDREENDRAIPQLLELTRLVSDDHEIRAELGRLYRRSGRLRDAQYWYRQALAINPFDVDYHEAYGDVCMQAGDARTALTEYRWLTKFEPDVADHFAKAAFAAKRLGDKKQMRTFATKAIALDPNSPAKALLD